MRNRNPRFPFLKSWRWRFWSVVYELLPDEWMDVTNHERRTYRLAVSVYRRAERAGERMEGTP